MFWAFLIFVLNFIPALGSIVATLLPVAFSMLQFGDYMPGLVLLFSVNASAFDAKFSAEVSGYFNSNKLTYRNLDTDFRTNTIGATGKVLAGGCIIKYTFAQGFKTSNEFLITEQLS